MDGVGTYQTCMDLQKMPHYMLWFGSANNFSGQIGERSLKAIVKDHAARTQQCPATFAEQCAVQEFESNVIKHVMTDLSNQLVVSAHNCTRSAAKSELQGKFTLTISETNNRGIGVSQDKVSWHDKKKDKMRFHVSDLFIFAIRRYSHVRTHFKVYLHKSPGITQKCSWLEFISI